MSTIVLFLNHHSLAGHVKSYLQTQSAVSSKNKKGSLSYFRLPPEMEASFQPNEFILPNYTGFTPECWDAFKVLMNTKAQVSPQDSVFFYYDVPPIQGESKDNSMEIKGAISSFSAGFFDGGLEGFKESYNPAEPSTVKNVIVIHDNSPASKKRLEEYRNETSGREYHSYPLPEATLDPDYSFYIKENARIEFLTKIINEHSAEALTNPDNKAHLDALSKRKCYDEKLCIDHLNAALLEGIARLNTRYHYLLLKGENLKKRLHVKSLSSHHLLSQKQQALLEIMKALDSLLLPSYRTKVSFDWRGQNFSAAKEAKPQSSGGNPPSTSQAFIQRHEQMVKSDDFVKHLSVLSRNSCWAPWLANAVLNLIFLPFVFFDYLGRTLNNDSDKSFGYSFFEPNTQQLVNEIRNKIEAQIFCVNDSFEKRLEILEGSSLVPIVPPRTAPQV